MVLDSHEKSLHLLTRRLDIAEVLDDIACYCNNGKGGSQNVHGSDASNVPGFDALKQCNTALCVTVDILREVAALSLNDDLLFRRGNTPSWWLGLIRFLVAPTVAVAWIGEDSSLLHLSWPDFSHAKRCYKR